jgi:hypothetical protein
MRGACAGSMGKVQRASERTGRPRMAAHSTSRCSTGGAAIRCVRATSSAGPLACCVTGSRVAAGSRGRVASGLAHAHAHATLITPSSSARTARPTACGGTIRCSAATYAPALRRRSEGAVTGNHCSAANRRPPSSCFPSNILSGVSQPRNASVTSRAAAERGARRRARSVDGADDADPAEERPAAMAPAEEQRPRRSRHATGRRRHRAGQRRRRSGCSGSGAAQAHGNAPL